MIREKASALELWCPVIITVVDHPSNVNPPSRHQSLWPLAPVKGISRQRTVGSDFKEMQRLIKRHLPTIAHPAAKIPLLWNSKPGWRTGTGIKTGI